MCAEQPGEMNIKLRMYIGRIVNFLDTKKKFGGLAIDIWSPVYLQIRERLKRKMNIVFPFAADHGNSAKKNSQVNPIDAGEVCAVKLQSFKE